MFIISRLALDGRDDPSFSRCSPTSHSSKHPPRVIHSLAYPLEPTLFEIVPYSWSDIEAWSLMSVLHPLAVDYQNGSTVPSLYSHPRNLPLCHTMTSARIKIMPQAVESSPFPMKQNRRVVFDSLPKMMYSLYTSTRKRRIPRTPIPPPLSHHHRFFLII